MRARHLFNAFYALVTPLGAALFYLVSTQFAGQGTNVLGQVLGFAAGAFICIASSDLLPELQFHGHDRGKLSLALVTGILLAWGTVFLEGGHDHQHGPSEHGLHDHEHSESEASEHEHDDHEHGHEHETPCGRQSRRVGWHWHLASALCRGSPTLARRQCHPALTLPGLWRSGCGGLRS